MLLVCFGEFNDLKRSQYVLMARAIGKSQMDKNMVSECSGGPRSKLARAMSYVFVRPCLPQGKRQKVFARIVMLVFGEAFETSESTQS
jgi:hypothetical protein